MTADGFLQRVYDLQTQEATNSYYSAWAQTYDDELVDNGYRSPVRCAAALAQFVALDAPILDVGCGTGLSGAALAAAGFASITGSDVNADMLEVARRTDVYQELMHADPANLFLSPPAPMPLSPLWGSSVLAQRPPACSAKPFTHWRRVVTSYFRSTTTQQGPDLQRRPR